MVKEDEDVLKLAQIVDSQLQQQTSVQVTYIRTIVETLQRPVQRLVDESTIYAKKGSSSSSILLLHGIPGSGKTHLITAVVDAFLEERLLNTLCAPIAYFYYGDSRFGRKWADPEELMRSITRQFAIVDKEKLKIHESVSLKYAHREAEAKLDGFEIPKLRRIDDMNLLHALTRIRDESASVVKIFLSSRDNSNIFAGLPDASKVRVQETDSRQDMEMYVRHRVSTVITSRKLLNDCVPDDLQQQLIDFLLKKAGEMFLGVNLQMERFCKLRSAKSVIDEIKDPSSISATINSLYSDILENLKQTDPIAIYWPFQIAAYIGDLSMMEFLIEQGAHKNDTGGLFGSALIAAMIKDRHDAFNFLLAACGINVNLWSAKHGTALHYACRYKDAKTVQLLLDHGLDVNLDGLRLESPLAAALSRVVTDPSQRRMRRFKSADDNFEEVLNVLLRYGHGLQIRDADLVLAAQVPSYHLRLSKKTALECLFEDHADIAVTQDMIAAAVPLDDSSEWGLKTLLDHANGVEITTEILNSVRSSGTLSALFQFQPRCEISSEVFEAFSRVDYGGPYLLEVLLDQEPQAIPPQLNIVSFLERDTRVTDHSVDILRALLNRAPDMEITDNILMAVTHPDQLRLLLPRYRCLLVPDNVLASVFSENSSNYKLKHLKIFFNHYPTLKIGPGPFSAWSEDGDADCLEAFLGQDPDLSIPSNFPSTLINILRWCHRAEDVVEVLLRYGKKVNFTPENRRDIDELLQLQSENDLKRLLLSLEHESQG
ncbi:hypothetical protein N7517_011209 [Penicillium concentricum]|uniref:Nephrocystin 3-like N-terminal domain-containing protein n=1 Tax=Penicillium concentricum TaxID=293559 RepID=A0A9W9RAC0_9EURO|nr:uncharacterized protein N7517_011209 [Penicillium concentricum]KAJ5356600.1 hypothetical protein N7517_011209 [Penicillium concentricum]